MNTKTFAQTARRILMDGVAQKLLYWGFTPQGEVVEEPVEVEGGYTFRGEVYDNETVPALWQKLKTAIRKKGIEVIVEEAAYTWFNRMMALRILAKNDYEEPQLSYVKGMKHTPYILQRARQGEYSFLTPSEQKRLRKLIGDYNKDAESFALLLVGYCHNHQTLNKVFGKLDDYTELLLPDNMLQENGFLHLLNTTDAISDDEYQKVELIGWLYQFYISERKDEVFASFKKKKKAEAKDIPAATQIFTPNWIVKYMVENTAGKLWLDYKPDSEIRDKMKYLVDSSERQGPRDETTPSSLTTHPSSLITDVEELTLIDPACGSGHILVEGFDLLYQMYMEEYYTPEEAVQTIFEKNLYGLDIDERAAQLATFAVLLKAAIVYPDVWNKDWFPNIYAMPEADSFSREEVEDFLGEAGTAYVEDLGKALQLMQDAENLGSVMQFNLSPEAINYIQQRYQDLQQDQSLDFNLQAILHKAHLFIPVLLLLSQKYTAVVANPPYMGQKSMNGELKNYVNAHYPMTKSDLMTIFMEVIPNLTIDNARFALINLPSWLFLSSFEKIRKYYIDHFSFDSLLHMGRGIFGIDFGSVAFAIKKGKNENAVGSYFRLHERNFQHIYYEDIEKLFLYSNNNEPYKYDFKQYRGEEGITEIPENGTENGLKLFYPNIPQSNFEKIPGCPIAYWIKPWEVEAFSCQKPFSEFASPSKGMMPGSSFLLFNWEVAKTNVSKSKTAEQSKNDEKKWYRYFKGGSYRKWYGNQEYIVLFYRNGKILKENNYGERNPQYYFKRQINWSKIGSGKFSARDGMVGGLYDDAACQCPVNEEYDFEYLLAYLNSCVAEKLLQIIHNTLNYSPGEIAKIPTTYNSSDDVSVRANFCISISKKDWDSRETSWDFEQSPLLLSDQGLGMREENSPLSTRPSSLSEAYERWKKDVTQDFFQLHQNEEELNRIFIDIYGLQEELTPEVPLKDITILQEELDRKQLEQDEVVLREQGLGNRDKGIENSEKNSSLLTSHSSLVPPNYSLPIDKAEVMRQFISYCIGIFMGRYRLDKPGLNIAHPNPTAEELAHYTYNNHEIQIDEDAILPLMGNNCNFHDDVVLRIHHLLDVIWGHEMRTENLNFIQECLNKDLDKFLVKDFYKYHCKMYKKKPIYWLFSSKNGAFQVLVYMHRMNEFTVEKIRANYLLEHLKNLRAEEAMLKSNESGLNTQEARKLEQLRKDIHECEAYDMELKEVADQQIKFDLDDGVTANYKLFEKVVAKIK